MNDKLSDDFEAGMKQQAKINEVLEKLMAVARSGTVYSEPVTAGEYTVITAAEVSVGVGLGHGFGSGTGSELANPKAINEKEMHEGASKPGGFGGASGGGGISQGRPVAVISIGPKGVQVTPVIDVTKLGLTFLTVLGSMFLVWRKMRRLN